MKTKLQKHYRLLSFLSGWLAVAALPPYYAFPVLFISFSLLLWLIQNSATKGMAFKSGYYFGFAFFAFGLIWINNALLLDAKAFGWLVPIVFLASGFFFGLFIAIPAWLCWYAKKDWARYLAFAAFFVIFEWLRSFFLTGFPWNLLGSTLAFSDILIQAAGLGGTYFLSLLVLLAAGAPFLYFNSKSKKRLKISASIIVVILVFLGSFGYFKIKAHPRQASSTIIRLVQPAIPQSLKWNAAALSDNLEQYIKLSQLPGFENVDFIIWGETAFPYAIEQDIYHRQMLQYAIPPQGYLITGALRYEDIQNEQYKVYNSLFILDKSNKIVAIYDKFHLVPFGEYIPLRKYLPEWIKPIANAIGSFEKGLGPEVIKIPEYPSLGGLICYEVIFPHQILDNNNRPQWMVNLTNDGWYGDSAGPYQHLVAARLRAVEEGITIARVAGSGISALISPLGIVLDQIGLHKNGILDIALPIETEFSTTYSRLGNNVILLLCAFLLAVAFVQKNADN